MDFKPFVMQRIKTLQSRMAEMDLQVIVLQKPENVFYFSHFNPVLNSHPVFVVVPLNGIPTLLIHSIRYLHAKMEGGLDQIHCYGKWGNVKPLANTPIEAISILLDKKPDRIGLEHKVASLSFVEELIRTLNLSKTQDISGMIDLMKIVKDDHEISSIRKAANLVDVGVKTTIEFLEKGYSEAAACTEGQYQMRQIWHHDFPDSEVCGFGTSEGGMIDSLHVWCLSNEHIAYGCDCPKHYYPKTGDISLPMAWAKVDGYHAENERTIIVGKLTGIRKQAYQAMLAARGNILSILKPGVTFEELYLQAMQAFIEYGFEDILPGRVGHGVGSSAHEFPSLTKGNQIRLQPGMVITVEPGLMDSVWGGARHSDTVLITPQGYESLTKLPSGEISIL